MNGITVDYRDRRPIYEQLVGNVCDLILRGILQPDEQLPSVRALAAALGINPNTIQKAYAELERRGVSYSLPGRGNFIASDLSALRSAHRAELLAQIAQSMESAAAYGVSKAEIDALAADIFTDKEEKQR